MDLPLGTMLNETRLPLARYCFRDGSQRFRRDRLVTGKIAFEVAGSFRNTL